MDPKVNKKPLFSGYLSTRAIDCPDMCCSIIHSTNFGRCTSTTGREIMSIQEVIAFFPPEMYSFYVGSALFVLVAGLSGAAYLFTSHAAHGQESAKKTYKAAMFLAVTVAVALCSVTTYLVKTGAFIQYAAVQ